jgi:hypothetical protein
LAANLANVSQAAIKIEILKVYNILTIKESSLDMVKEFYVGVL